MAASCARDKSLRGSQKLCSLVLPLPLLQTQPLGPAHSHRRSVELIQYTEAEKKEKERAPLQLLPSAGRLEGRLLCSPAESRYHCSWRMSHKVRVQQKSMPVLVQRLQQRSRRLAGNAIPSTGCCVLVWIGFYGTLHDSVACLFASLHTMSVALAPMQLLLHAHITCIPAIGRCVRNLAMLLSDECTLHSTSKESQTVRT